MRRGITALAILLLVVLAIGPVPLVTSLWTAPATITAAARVGDPAFAVLGVVLLVIALVAVALLLCVPGVLAARRRSTVAALALTIVVTGVGIAPIGSTSPLLHLPGGRLGLAAIGIVTALLCAWCLRGADAEPGRSVLARLGTVAAAAVVGLSAVLGYVGTGIPDGPVSLLVPQGSVLRPVAEPLPVMPAPRNPYLADVEGSTIHNDAWMTDTYTDRRITDPATARVESFFAGGDCASILFDRRGRLVTTCVSATRVTAYVLDPMTLQPLASRELASRDFTPTFLTDFSGGGYAVLDAEQRLVVPQYGGIIARFATEVGDQPAIEPVDTFDVSRELQPGEQITSVVPDWTGPLWFVGRDGTVGLLDTRTGRTSSVRFEGRVIENSFAVAQGSGAYVVTSSELAFLQIGDGMRPLVSWTAAYDAGARTKPGQTSTASGTTPTIMLGGRFVAITDNADPQMHVEVYDAEPGARDRLVCRVPVFTGGRSATENSLVAAGNAIFVENNYGYRAVDAVGGRSSEPGVTRIDVDPEMRSCSIAWENRMVRIPSLVSKVSAQDGLFLTYAKDPSVLGIDAWSFTALDATSGEVAWTRLAGTGALFNNHYAALYVGPTGAIYVGTIAGVVALLP